jgi:uncharacterized protein YndB with AHSA1/START domain
MIGLGMVLLVLMAPPAKAGSSDRVLRATLVLDAPPGEIWALWTTERGIASFFAPAARVDGRVDGEYGIHFAPTAPDGHKGADGMRILVFEPERRLSFTWNAPDDQPYARAQRTVVTVELDPVGRERTRMTFTHAGWGRGPEWDRAYEYFDRAWNAVVLPRLRHRLAHGPIDWARPPELQPVAATLKRSLAPVDGR